MFKIFTLTLWLCRFVANNLLRFNQRFLRSNWFFGFHFTGSGYAFTCNRKIGYSWSSRFLFDNTACYIGQTDMNSLATMFLLVDATLLLLVSRRWATLPLLIGACYIPAYLSIDLGPLHFTAIRVLVAFGIVRMMIRQEFPAAK